LHGLDGFDFNQLIFPAPVTLKLMKLKGAHRRRDAGFERAH